MRFSGSLSDIKLGILGGTGVEGRALALRFAEAGFSVAIGSREAEKAREKARELSARLGKSRFTGGENAAIAASCNLVFLTTPFVHARELIDACRKTFQPGSVLVDVTVPITLREGSVQLLALEEGSGSEHLASYLPEGTPLVAAFKTIPAKVLGDLDTRLDCDLFVCGDSGEAKARVMQCASQLGTLRPIDAGPLREARALERMTALAIGINRRYKVKAGRFRVVGL